MIPLSGRHAPWPAVAVWMLAAVAGFHALARPTVDDCADPRALLAPDLFPQSLHDSARSGVPRKYAFAQNEGKILVRERWRNAPHWRLMRTYDLTHSYFAPPALFSMVSPEDREWIVRREAGGRELPIHVRVDDSSGSVNVAAYLYVFAGEPVARPFVASVAAAVPQLLGGARPINVIVAEGDAEMDRSAAAEEFLVDWIRSAWLEFDAVCGP